MISETHRSIPDFLLEGYHQFYQQYFIDSPDLFQDLAHGQHPEVLIICCCDSRIVPSLLFNLKPGQAFIVRNVGNIVGPYHKNASEPSVGTCTALEYGVKVLGIKRIVVLGHSQCGAVKGLMHDTQEFEYLDTWLYSHKQRLAEILKDTAIRPEDRLWKCEQQSIVESIKNLRTFPWICDQVEIFGFHFDIKTGILLQMHNKYLG
jgi:carbonic anhydrase